MLCLKWLGNNQNPSLLPLASGSWLGVTWLTGALLQSLLPTLRGLISICVSVQISFPLKRIQSLN